MRCLTLEKSSKAVFPINRNTAVHMRHTQSSSVEDFIAPLVLFAASNASARRIAHFLRLQDAMLIKWRSLRIFMQADFHVRQKMAHKNVRMNRKNKLKVTVHSALFAKPRFQRSPLLQMRL